MARQLKNGQDGFTLIEIISVLVLLGILAAVAVPRYFDMQAAAQRRAAFATLSEIQARVNQTFAQALLNNVACANARVLATTDGADLNLDLGNNVTSPSVTAIDVADTTSATTSYGFTMNGVDYDDTDTAPWYGTTLPAGVTAAPTLTVPVCN